MISKKSRKQTLFYFFKVVGIYISVIKNIGENNNNNNTS